MNTAVFQAGLSAGGRRIGTAAVLSLLATTSVPALTADELWTAWKTDYAALGYEVKTGSTARSGDTLTITDLALSHQIEDPDTSDGTDTGEAPKTPVTITTRSEIDIPRMDLREKGDGSVVVTLAPTITARSDVTRTGDDPASVTLRIDQQDMNTLVSGTPEALDYRLTAPKVTITLVDDTPAPKPGAKPESAAPAPTPAQFTLTLGGIASHYTTRTADGQQTQTSDTRVASIDVKAAGSDDESGIRYTLTASAADLAGTNQATVPAGTDMTDMGALLAQGASFAFSGTYGAATLDVTQTAEDKPMEIVASAQSGAVNGAMSAAGFRYSAQSQRPHLAMTQALAGQVPMPMSADLESTSTEFAFPVSHGDQPQPFTGKIALNGLTLSDSVWALFDPTQKLPRAPAELVIDLGGTAKISNDLLTATPVPGAGMPATVESLTLNRLHLSLAGLDLTGTGAATVDNSSGAPVPAGSVDLSLTGADALMSNLVAIGLIEQQQTTIAKMMLGLYAVPAGTDAYTSKIEMKPTGEILANGQRIR